MLLKDTACMITDRKNRTETDADTMTGTIKTESIKTESIRAGSTRVGSRQMENPGKRGLLTREILLILQWLAFLCHLVCGLYYFWGIFRGNMYY